MVATLKLVCMMAMLVVCLIGSMAHDINSDSSSSSSDMSSSSIDSSSSSSSSDGEFYRQPVYDNSPSLRSAQRLWHRTLTAHDQSYNSVALSARHPSSGSSLTLPSVPQFAASGRKQQFMDSFAEGIDVKNNTQFHIAANQSATWVITARHAYNKPAGVVNLFVVHQIGSYPHSTAFQCEITGYDAIASKPIWTYQVSECRFAPLDFSQYRRGLVSDDGSTLAIALISNSTYNGDVGAEHAQLHVIDAQSGKAKFVHRLSTLDVAHHSSPSVSGRGEFITSVAGSRCDVYTSTGELRTKNQINIHHESLVYMDASGNYLVYHDVHSNLHVLRWEASHDNYTHVVMIPARDEKTVEWHPIDWEISYDDNLPYLAITWTRGRTLRTQSKLTLYDLSQRKTLWTFQSSRSRQYQTELIPSFQAPYIGVASWSNDDGSDAQLMLFHTRSNVPIWSHHTGGSLWTIQIVVASAIPSLSSSSSSLSSLSSPNAPTDVIYLIAAGSSHHVHVPGVGQAYAYDLEFSR